MPPRTDPYATKTHKRIDIALVLITLTVMLFAFRLSAQQRENSTAPNKSGASQTQQAVQK